MDLVVRSVLWLLSVVGVGWALAVQGCRPAPPVPLETQQACEASCASNGGMESVELDWFRDGSCKCVNGLYMPALEQKDYAFCAEACEPNDGVLWHSRPKVECTCENGGKIFMDLPDATAPTPLPMDYYYLEPRDPTPSMVYRRQRAS